ncbi:hypothetical protein [Methanogenium cariaci]|uniref:hypothetical protein n=1 Tax=Methanogenium cariaci TaxID=2197 RepID=UPI000784EDB6|nr:hypothetical protein [Methanogenium cariaci]
MKNVDVDALFIGPKSENRDYFKEMMNFLVDEHLFWRRDFHPNDPEYIKIRERYSEDFMLTQERMTETLHELSSRLKESSMPWASPPGISVI